MSVRDILQAAAGLGGGVEKGPLFSAGQNSNGILGANLANNVSVSSPVQIGALDNWVYVTAQGGSKFAFAINSAGDLYAWGKNNNTVGGGGNLGDNTDINRSSPVQIGSGKTWAAAFPLSTVDNNREYAFAITESGQLWALGGDNQNGQLGINTTALPFYSSPIQVGSGTNWKQLAGGSEAVLATKTDGTLWWWGRDQYGQAGNGIGPPGSLIVSSPVQVGALSDWDQVANAHTTLAVKTNGTLWAWGLNDYGTCGLGNTVARSSPVQVGALSNWAQVSIGNYQGGPVVALKTDGTLWAWGRGVAGILGTGDTIDRSSPVQIGAGTDWAYVRAGDFNAIAIKTDGTVWGWGVNQNGQFGNSNVINTSSPVQIGGNAVCIDATVADNTIIYLRA